MPRTVSCRSPPLNAVAAPLSVRSLRVVGPPLAQHKTGRRTGCRSRRRGAVRMWRWRWTRSAEALPLSSVSFARRCRRRWTSRRCAWRWAGVPWKSRMWSDLSREAWLLCRRRLLRVLLPRCVRRVMPSMTRFVQRVRRVVQSPPWGFALRHEPVMCVCVSCILMRVLFVLPVLGRHFTSLVARQTSRCVPFLSTAGAT